MERQHFIECTSGNLIDSKNVFQQNNFDMNVCEKAFRNACFNGRLEIAQWLLSVKPSINISAGNEYAFRLACENGHLKTAQWLQTLCPEKYSVYINDNGMNILTKRVLSWELLY